MSCNRFFISFKQIDSQKLVGIDNGGRFPVMIWNPVCGVVGGGQERGGENSRSLRWSEFERAQLFQGGKCETKEVSLDVV